MLALAALLMVKAVGLVGAAYGAAEATPPEAGASAAPHGGGQAAEPAPAPAETPPTMPPAAQTAQPHGEHPADEKTPDEKPAGEHANAAAESKPASDPAAGAKKVADNMVNATPAEPPTSPAERALLLDLRKRRLELDSRAAALDQRETLLGAAEKRIALRVDELTSLQKRLEAMDAARRDRDEASWRGLVRVYETMKPKDAAVIFNDLDSTVLLQVVDRMKDGKAAAIMAAMTPERARRLTTDLSALRSRANAPPDPVAANDAGQKRPQSAMAPPPAKAVATPMPTPPSGVPSSPAAGASQ